MIWGELSARGLGSAVGAVLVVLAGWTVGQGAPLVAQTLPAEVRPEPIGAGSGGAEASFVLDEASVVWLAPEGGEEGWSLRFSLSNRGRAALGSVRVGVLVESEEGELEALRVLRLEDLGLLPGESRRFERRTGGLGIGPAARVSVAPVLPGDPGALAGERFEVGLEDLRDEITATQQGQTSVAERLGELSRQRRREREGLVPSGGGAAARAAAPTMEGVDLDECVCFCLECPRIAAVVCTGGVERIDCKCAEGECDIFCK